jgi:murein DD-endopeptidase MepM/ murein hydrolase activator NlpD
MGRNKSIVSVLLSVAMIIPMFAGCSQGGQSGSSGAVPSGWPVDPSSATISSGFGPRGAAYHQGIDIAVSKGTPARATADGTVIVAERQKRYGRTVVIDHGGRYQTRYAHLKRIDTSKGKRVEPGDAIGRVGSSGKSSGAHLHYEVVSNGVRVNPQPYLD